MAARGYELPGVDRNVFATSNISLTSSELDTVIREYFENASRSGGGRIVLGEIPRVSDKEFILCFLKTMQ